MGKVVTLGEIMLRLSTRETHVLYSRIHLMLFMAVVKRT